MPGRAQKRGRPAGLDRAGMPPAVLRRSPASRADGLSASCANRRSRIPCARRTRTGAGAPRGRLRSRCPGPSARARKRRQSRRWIRGERWPERSLRIVRSPGERSSSASVRVHLPNGPVRVVRSAAAAMQSTRGGPRGDRHRSRRPTTTPSAGRPSAIGPPDTGAGSAPRSDSSPHGGG